MGHSDMQSSRNLTSESKPSREMKHDTSLGSEMLPSSEIERLQQEQAEYLCYLNVVFGPQIH